MRRMLASRSSLEKPRPLLRFVRTSSPSSTSILTPRARSCGMSAFVSVVLPAPDSPVNHIVNPRVTNLSPFVIKRMGKSFAVNSISICHMPYAIWKAITPQIFCLCAYQVATAPCNVSLEAAAGIEPAYKGFADLRLTTWLRRLKLRIADCGFMSLFNCGCEIEIESFINPQSAILSCRRAQPAQPFDQNLRDFRPREFDRRDLTAREHLAHARAAQADVVRLVVRAGLER